MSNSEQYEQSEPQEDPIYSPCINPYSLCMRVQQCSYCSMPSKHSTLIYYLFGILSCETHRAWAIRDCQAYMHEKKIVTIQHARKVSCLSKLFTYLEDFSGQFYIKRTNGDIENGWMFENVPYDTLSEIDGKWAVKVYNSKNISKYVWLEDIVTYSKNVFPEDFSACVKEVLEVLEKGLFLEMYEKRKLHCASADVKETPGVQQVQLENGSSVRVFIPEGMIV